MEPALRAHLRERQLRGDHAETVQLAIEYAPAPPFDSGRPELAREPVLRVALERMDAQRVRRDAAIRRAAATALGIETARATG